MKNILSTLFCASSLSQVANAKDLHEQVKVIRMGRRFSHLVRDFIVQQDQFMHFLIQSDNTENANKFQKIFHALNCGMENLNHQTKQTADSSWWNSVSDDLRRSVIAAFETSDPIDVMVQ